MELNGEPGCGRNHKMNRQLVVVQNYTIRNGGVKNQRATYFVKERVRDYKKMGRIAQNGYRNEVLSG